MRYADLVQLYFDRSNALQWYWTLYVVVAGGLLAFSSLRVRPDVITAVLVTVLFAMFAYKNAGAIGDTTFQRMAALKAIQDYPHSEQDGAALNVARAALEPTLAVPAWEGVRNFHVCSDVLVILAVWAMELRRRRAARATTAAQLSPGPG